MIASQRRQLSALQSRAPSEFSRVPARRPPDALKDCSPTAASAPAPVEYDTEEEVVLVAEAEEDAMSRTSSARLDM